MAWHCHDTSISHSSAYVIIISEVASSTLQSPTMLYSLVSTLVSEIRFEGILIWPKRIKVRYFQVALSSAGPVERPLSLQAENNLVPLQTPFRALNPPEHYTMRLAPAFVVASLALCTIAHAAPHAVSDDPNRGVVFLIMIIRRPHKQTSFWYHSRLGE